jgi:hypothetical protein
LQNFATTTDRQTDDGTADARIGEFPSPGDGDSDKTSGVQNIAEPKDDRQTDDMTAGDWPGQFPMEPAAGDSGTQKFPAEPDDD